jgi:hypothetical protein
VGGIRDWLSDGVTGRLVPLDGDRVRRFADAIVRTLSDRDGLDAMKSQAPSMAGRFTMDAHVRALEPILHEAAARGSGRTAARRRP